MGFVAMKAATVAVHPMEHPMYDHDDEPEHGTSPTDQVIQELRLYGYHPNDGETIRVKPPRIAQSWKQLAISSIH